VNVRISVLTFLDDSELSQVARWDIRLTDSQELHLHSELQSSLSEGSKGKKNPG